MYHLYRFGAERNDAFANKLEDVAGGLSPQIDAIVRRVLDGRVFRPVELGVDDEATGAMIGTDGSTWRYADDEDNSSVNSSVKAFMEAKELEILGLTPVRGLLLYGPPGCGKVSSIPFHDAIIMSFCSLLVVSLKICLPRQWFLFF